MAVWTNEALRDLRERIGQMGLRKCVVCGSEDFAMAPSPTVMHLGGHEHQTGRDDSAIGLVYYAAVECEACGHTLFFNSDKIVKDPSLRLPTERPE